MISPPFTGNLEIKMLLHEDMQEQAASNLMVVQLPRLVVL